MTKSTKFRVRLRVRIAKSLTTEVTNLTVSVASTCVTITSQSKNEPLNKAKWIILRAGGFPTEMAADYFGNQLRSILLLAAFSSRLGVDVGEDLPTCCISEEFARSTGFLKDSERLAPNIHGLTIVPDDD